MKKLFGVSKHASKAPAAAALDDPAAGAHHSDAQTGYVQAIGAPLALGSNREPVSPTTVDYALLRHQQQQQSTREHVDRHAAPRKQQHQYRDSNVAFGVTDENWELISNPSGQRGDDTGALPNPHPPALVASRTSSLGSLAPGASPPLSAPQGSPLTDAIANASPGNNAPAGTPVYNMLRKRPPQNKELPQPLPPPQTNGIGSATAILRALDPRAALHYEKSQAHHTTNSISNHQRSRQNSAELAEPNLAPPTDDERERDSRELEREREWRERDREIRATETIQQKPRQMDYDRERERERDRDKDRDRDREGRIRHAVGHDRDRLQPDNRESRRKKESSRERSRSKERDREDKKSQWTSIFSKDARHDRERDEHQAEQLSRMIGFLTAQTNIDWSMALDICERASASDLSAKQAAKALRREFRYGEPASQLSAARLWAIMTQNCSDDFLAHTNSKKFVECLESVITSSRTSPVVRDRLIDVLGAAVFKLSVTQPDGKEVGRDTLRGLWLKNKPEGAPEEGVCLPSDDMLFNPVSTRGHQRQVAPHPPGYEPRPEITERVSSRSTKSVIPYDEDVRRLFQECKIGKGNAQLLNEALAFAGPDDLQEKDIIKEFYTKCRASLELISAQIPWASAGAERSRAQQGLQRPRQTQDEVMPMTVEEKLLADLLKSNEELQEALRIYDDLERLGVEREFERTARERSRVETRHIPDYHDDYLEPPGMVSSGSRSRSPSPSPGQQRDLGPYLAPQFPPPASITSSNSWSSQLNLQPPAHTHPPRTLRGPRSPAPPPRSRSPSPSRSSTPSLPGSRSHSRTSSLEGGFDVQRHVALGIAQVNGKLPSPLHMEARVSPPVVEPPTPVVEISVKAQGKRKITDTLERGDPLRPSIDDDALQEEDPLFFTNDTDDIDPSLASHERRKPTLYVYDAAAERTKEWLKESGSRQSFQ